MTIPRLVLRSLRHYWRTNLAVLLGVVAGTAVIGGALVVGDSVRDSLETMSLERLGEVDHVLHGTRFFREDLATSLAKTDGFEERFASAASLIVVRGSFVHTNPDGDASRVSQVTIYGVDERAWKLLDHGGTPVPSDDAERRARDVAYRSPVVLNSRVAGPEGLNVVAGDDVSLNVEIPETIPGESLFGRTRGATTKLELEVSAVLEPETPASRLSLQPGQQLPLVAFVGLDRLQTALRIDEIEEDPRSDDEPRSAKVNAIFTKADAPADSVGDGAPAAAERLTELVREAWTLEDLGLHVRPYRDSGYAAVESEAMILDDPTARAAERVAEADGRPRSTVLVYLANQFEELGGSGDFSRYGVVAGVAFAESSPFGPFPFKGATPTFPLDDDQVVVNSWLANDLAPGDERLEVGDRLFFTYQPVGSHGDVPPDDVDFDVVGIVPLEDSDGEPTRANDRGFTPLVPGVTDVESYDDWDKPYWMQKENKEVTPRDDLYWDTYRATPKAFISLERARELWRSRYGGQTSVRIGPRKGETVNRAAEEIGKSLLAELDPADVGFAFQPVKDTGLRAAAGTTSFTGLFLGFSFFLIASATILIVLLFRLGIERRVSQIGLLESVGWSPRSVGRLYLAEGLVVVIAGGLLGCLAAVGYAAIMVHGLRTWWSGAIGTRFLYVSVHPLSLLCGFAISVGIAAIAIAWSFRGLGRLSARELLAGRSEPTLDRSTRDRRHGWAVKVGRSAGLVAVLISVGVLTGLVPDDIEAFSGFSLRVVGFFLVGTLLLVASLSEFSAMLHGTRGTAVSGRGAAGLARLGERNASRHRQRSVFTTALIASATFVIVAVAAGRQDLASTEPRVRSGNGGFLLVAETDHGLLFDLNTEEGRAELGLDPRTPDEERLVDDMFAMPFRMKPGQDASCLNLYQTRLPTMLGAPPAMVELGGFAFADTSAADPWALLEEPLESDDGVPVYPVLGDMNTLMYSLHKGVGQTISVPDDERPDYRLKVVGMFAGSVFQGVLVLSEENFETLYPDRDGYEYFLVGGRREGGTIRELPPEELATFLETRLQSTGFDAEPIGRRLNAFLAVQNTYLETFQTLGGLGLLLGTLGLATVMLRNVLERRSEFALLRAVGFDDRAVGWMVLVENAFLLVWGLVAGTVAALLAMLPQLRSSSADVPWLGGAGLLLLVFVVGMLSALWAVRAAIRTPIVGTLRAE